ncbi:MAG: hypothetical protein E7035_05575 [Verrucomicrobiaceae bacterium]|nr:hypothetical protein [Verrucomicrobiaceae bacterium]
MSRFLVKLMFVVCTCLLTACNSTKTIIVIDADTGKPIDDVLVNTSTGVIACWIYCYLDTTDKNGKVCIPRKPTILAKEGYWISGFYPRNFDEKTQTYTCKMYKLENKFPYKNWNYKYLNSSDTDNPSIGYTGVITDYFGLRKRKFLNIDKKSEYPDWERLRQIWISARNQYELLNQQTKKTYN